MTRQFATFTVIAAVTAALCGSSPASAHHAFSAEFDSDSPVQLKGKITRLQWINPHAWFHIAAVQEDGTTVDWMIEGGTPNALMRSGINRDSLKVGTEIIVQGYQSKDRRCAPACKANGRDMTFSDGRKLFMGSSGTGAPEDGADPTDR